MLGYLPVFFNLILGKTEHNINQALNSFMN